MITSSDIRLIAMDLDDTLLNYLKKISRRSKNAMKQARDAGIELILITGRSYANALRFSQEIFSGLVVDNGGSGFDAQQQLLFSVPLLRSQTISIIEHLRCYGKKDVLYHCSTSHILATEPNQWEDTRKLFFPTESWEVDFIRESNLLDFCSTQPVQKVVAEFKRKRDLEILEQLCAGLNGLKTFITSDQPGRYRLEVCATTKAEGLKKYLALKGLDESQALIFGDGNNDIPMLKLGKGVAMGNASDSVKKSCKYSTWSNDDDGIARFLEKYVL